MYTYCVIEWADDQTIEEVIIKANDEVLDEEDDSIFFYGMSREKLEQAMENHTCCENEWFVVDINETTDEL